MKRCLSCLLMLSFCINAQDNDQLNVLIMQSPVKFIDNDKVAASAQQWVEKYIKSLNESEAKVVARTLHLGKTFSAVDAKMRTLVQQILISTCSLYKVMTAGGEDPRISKELEAEIEEFSKLKAYHSFAFHQWQDWVNMLSVAENRKIYEAIETVNEAVRAEIENSLAKKEWQMLADRVPAVAQETIESLTLLSTLCGNISNKSDSQESSGAKDEAVFLFDMIARASESGCQRSFATIESSSQILIYETLLLEISYVMFDTYLQAMSPEQRADI